MDVQSIPSEIMTKIFSYLTRRDRVSCALVCPKWQKAMYSHSLWKNVTVLLDADLSEPSAMLTMRQYHRFFKTMQFCWRNTYLPVMWMLQQSQNISKRACRYLIILCINNVKLHSVSLKNWPQSVKFNKIIYHLSRFLRLQISLQQVSFSNMDFSKPRLVKLLLACLNSSSSIVYLDISSCKPPAPLTYELATFISGIQQLTHLNVLKIDYLTLSNGIMQGILQAKNDNIELLDVFISDYVHGNISVHYISDEDWEKLSTLCPKLRVSFYFKDIAHFNKVSPYLNRMIPLTTFSMSCDRVTDHSRNRQYGRTLLLLISYYYKTLENVYLQINYNLEIVDDLILVLLRKCVNLQRLDFNGIVGNMELLRDISNMHLQNKIEGFRFYHVYPKSVSFVQHITLSEISRNYKCQLKNIDIDFQICSTCHKNEIVVYY